MLNDIDWNKVTVAKWCNACNSQEADHRVQVEVEGIPINLEICDDCMNKAIERGMLRA